MEKQILHLLGLSGTTAVIILIVLFLVRNLILERIKSAIKYEYERDLKRLDDELRKKTDTELARLDANLSKEVELAKLKMGLYSKRQFDLYNELWTSLCKLKCSMELLWDRATEEYLQQFAEQLADTNRRLERSALLIEPRHYAELNEILNEFCDYRRGKEKLIELKRDLTSTALDDGDIRQLIDSNSSTRTRLRQYLPQMMECLRSQICGQ